MNRPTKEIRVVGNCPRCGAPIFSTWYPPCEESPPGDFVVVGHVAEASGVRPSCLCLAAANMEAKMEIERYEAEDGELPENGPKDEGETADET